MSDLALYFAECVVKSAVILLAALMLCIAFNRKSASLRHLILALGIGGALLVPVGQALLPQAQVVKLPSTKGRQDPAPPSPPVVFSTTPKQMDLNASSTLMSALEAEPRTPAAPMKSQSESESPESGFHWGLLIAAVWILGFLGVISRWALGLVMVRRLTSGSTRFPMDNQTEALMRRVGLERKVRILLAAPDTRVSPITWGYGRPRVLLPNDYNDWTEAQRESILLHEFAHIRRGDYLWQNVALACCALYWFNPLAWLSSTALRRSAEFAADDLVLSLGRLASEYASTLVAAAKSAKPNPGAVSVAGVSFMNFVKLENRIAAILNPSLVRSRATRTQIALALAVGAFALAGIALVGATQVARHKSYLVWKMTLTERHGTATIYAFPYKYMIYIYEELKPLRGSVLCRSSRASMDALDVQPFPNENLKLKNGQSIEPLRVVDSSYRSKLTKQGVSVTATDFEEVKRHFVIDLPPQADEIRDEFLAGKKGPVGPVVFYQGNLIGMVGNASLRRALDEYLHPTVRSKITSPNGVNSEYWELFRSTGQSFEEDIVHKLPDGVSLDSINANASSLGETNVWPFVKAIRISRGRSVPSQLNGISYNNFSIGPDELGTPQFLKNAAAKGVSVRPISSKEATDLLAVRFDDRLELRLAALADQRFLQRFHGDRMAKALTWEDQKVAETGNLSYYYPLKKIFSLDTGSEPLGKMNLFLDSTDLHVGQTGEIISPGKTLEIAYVARTPRPQPILTGFDPVSTEKKLRNASVTLNNLAREWADVSGKLWDESGHSDPKYRAMQGNSDEIKSIRRRIDEVANEAAQVAEPFGLLVGPKWDRRFLDSKISELKSQLDPLENRFIEEMHIFPLGGVSFYDKELAENLALVKRHQYRSLRRRREVEDHPMQIGPPILTITQAKIQRTRESLISINCRNESVKNVIGLLFKQTESPFSIDPRISGKITIRSRQAPLSMVLNRVCSMVNASYVVVDGLFQIRPQARLSAAGA